MFIRTGAGRSLSAPLTPGRRGARRRAGSSTAGAARRRQHGEVVRVSRVGRPLTATRADSLIRRRAALNMRNASGSSTSTADATLIHTSDVPASSTTSNHASQHSSVPVTIRQAMTIWRPRQNAQPVAGEREQQDEVEAHPGALPVQRVEGTVQGQPEDDDPAEQHGAGGDGHEQAELAAARQVDAEQGMRVVDGRQRVRERAPLRRAHLPQVCLVDHGRFVPSRHGGLTRVVVSMLWMLNSFTRTQASGRTPWTMSRAGTCSARCTARRVSGEVPDSCLLLEHTPVYTAGKRTAVSDRPFGDPGAPVIDVDRGGKITWHGPGQLTAYPIIKLRRADGRGRLRAGA